MIIRCAAAAAVVLALALTACGDDSGDGMPAEQAAGPAQVVEQAAARLDSVRSGRIDAALRAEVSFGVTQRLEITEEGPFADARGTELPRYAVEFSSVEGSALGASSSDGTPQRSGIVFDGSALYSRPAGSATFVKQSERAIELNRRTYSREQRALGPGRIPLLALTPGDWVSGARFAGETTVDGVRAHRIVGTLHVPRFLGDLRQAKANDFGLGITLTGDATKLERGGDDTRIAKESIELLVGRDDGRLRRLRARLDANVIDLPGAASEASQDAVGRVQVALDIDLTELDEPQRIEAPTAGGDLRQRIDRAGNPTDANVHPAKGW